MKKILILCSVLLMVAAAFSHAGPRVDTEDYDKDGISDKWEESFGLDPEKNDAWEDPDKDDLTNIEEFNYGTHPFEKDTDEDHLEDGEEVQTYGTNPVMSDTDGGGRPDGDEVSNGRDPLNPDDDSAASATSIRLITGWNLISFPISPFSEKVSEILSPVGGDYSAVWSYQKGVWKLYDPDIPGLSDLTRLEPGWGYWIKMKRSGTLTFSGAAAPKSLSLESGWNLVGYNSTTPMSAETALSSIKGKYVSVWVFMNGAWKSYDPENPVFSDLETAEPGYGYWINAKNACTWSLP